MPNYRSAYTPGGAIFLTLATFNRSPVFTEVDNVKRLRQAAVDVKAEIPFDITVAVMLPEHIYAVGNDHHPINTPTSTLRQK